MAPKDDDLLTFAEVAARFRAFTVPELRLIRHKNLDGFNKCVKKIGVRVYISLKAFEEWLKIHRCK